MAIVLLISYIVILIFLIVNFVKCLKSKAKWSRLFIFEIISTIFSAILLMYYNNLPGSGFMPGLTYIGEVLFSFGAMILYSIILGITLITKLILYLLEKKEQGKNYFPKIAIIIAIILLAYGVYTLILDLNNDINVAKTTAIIVDYNDIHPIVEYTIDNKTYEAEIVVVSQETLNSNLNDTIEIYYNKRQPSELGYLSYYENVYIPCFILTSFLFVIVIIKSKR